MRRFAQPVADLPWPGVEAMEYDLSCDMAQFPRLSYSMKEVQRAGKLIAGPALLTEPGVTEAFLIANNFRDAHAFPMRSVRHQLIAYIHRDNLSGITGARLKMMQSIRRKLRRLPQGLNQLQDLAGCRAIMDSMDGVLSLVESIRRDSHHTVRDEDDYISAPKTDGYRSHHLLLNYVGRGEAAIYTGRRVEVQIRTQLQHSWATAVEAVGLFRGENLKGGDGSPQWLRLFRLMSAELAELESCPVPTDLSDRAARVDELRALNNDLGAVATLDNIRNIVRWSEDAILPSQRPSYYLIEYHSNGAVTILPYFGSLEAVDSYDKAELELTRTGVDSGYSTATVLVESGKFEVLKRAYPNYFGDVQLFKEKLEQLISREGKKHRLKLQERTTTTRQPERISLAWLRRRFRWN